MLWEVYCTIEILVNDRWRWISNKAYFYKDFLETNTCYFNKVLNFKSMNLKILRTILDRINRTWVVDLRMKAHFLRDKIENDIKLININANHEYFYESTSILV